MDNYSEVNMAWKFRNLRRLQNEQDQGKPMKGKRHEIDFFPLCFGKSGQEWRSTNSSGSARGIRWFRELDSRKCFVRTITLQGDGSCLFIWSR